MNDLIYLRNYVSIPGSDLVVMAIAKDGTPYALRERQVSGSPSYDLDYAFSLIPYLTRMSEAGEDVPDYADVLKAVETANKRARA